MNERNEPNLTGDPSDYGGRRAPEDLRQAEEEQVQEQRTADGEPRIERGTADSALGGDDENGQPSP